MNSFYNMLISSITYKNGSLVAFSIPTTFGIELIIRNESFFGIGLGFCMLLCVLIAADFISGIWAAKVNKVEIESKLLAKTFYKCLMIFLFFWILYEIDVELTQKAGSSGKVTNFIVTHAAGFLSYVRTFVFILITLREWLSIGENSYKMFNKKFYIFSLVEKLFEIIERKFLKKVEEKMEEIGVDINEEEPKTE